MPVTPTYPGVYIEEIPSGVRTIVGVATSRTAFVGSTQKGPTHDPIEISNFGEFERNFGPLQVNGPMTYAVRQFFLNGGSKAIIVRVANEDAVKATMDVGGLLLEASGEGEWGNNLRGRIDHQTRDRDDPEPSLFNLTIRYKDDDTETTESFRNLSTSEEHPRYVGLILEELSNLVSVPEDFSPEGRPAENATPEDGSDPFKDDQVGSGHIRAENGNNGGDVGNDDILGELEDKKGIFALEKEDLFNILCLPPPTRQEEITPQTYAQALNYCVNRRALLLVDPPSDWGSVDAAKNGMDPFLRVLGTNPAKNAAVFFPRVKAADPLKENLLSEFTPCGIVAGICARTDVQRGVWKSPAGTEASLSGVNRLSLKMTDDENGQLNPLGINCLRTFRGYGHVVWGSRTMQGSDRLASEWKYLAVRRTTLFIEESLYRGTQWVVFEPNDEPLWSQIRLNVGGFMQTLFRQGAFQAKTGNPRDSFFVKCDAETTTQDDIDRGIVNIHVGFAPLKPAEFVIIKIQQMTGREDDA